MKSTPHLGWHFGMSVERHPSLEEINKKRQMDRPPILESSYLSF